MAEYVSEISDPKYKEEQEAYIAQLEAQNELPSGKALVRPSSGFVVKCTHRKRRDDNADSSKLYLNMVHSEQVAKPKANKTETGGSSWSLPYAIGPLRMEHDKSGNNLVPTFDCCFHPSSLRYAHCRKEFLDLVVDVAKDAAANAFEKSGDEVEIHSGYTILRGVSYKSGTTPKALLISCNANENGEERNDYRPETTMMPMASLIDADSSHEDTKVLVPKYKIVEQGVFDIADHTTAKPDAPAQRRPKQLVVSVYLDEATSAANINLDVSDRLLVIKPDPKSDVTKYSLELKLPYTVNSQKGNASFDVKRRILVVTLPVIAV